MTKKLNKKGFTIVELVIVIAVIAILAAVLIPTFADLVKKANLSADQVAIRNMNTALAAGTVDDGKIDVPEEVREVLYEAGYNSNNLVPTTKEHTFQWYLTDNKVILVDKEDNIVCPEEYKGKKVSDFATGTVYPLANLPYAKIVEIEGGVTLTPDSIAEGSGSAQIISELPLDKALQFTAVHTVEEAAELPYGNYIVDYVITIDQDLNQTETTYYLAGKYGSYEDGKWVLKNVTNLEAGSYKLLSSFGLGKWNYTEICDIVSEFQCGVAVKGNANGLEVKVELVMWESEADYDADTNGTKGQVVNTYVYKYN